MMTDLRSTLDMHGSNLIVHPAHCLQRRVVIAQLKLTAHEVLHLIDGHAGLLVVLYKEGERWLSTAEIKCRIK